MSDERRPQTLAQLKASGYRSRSVRDEIRSNLIKRIRNGEPIFEGLVGYDETVIPQVINALLSKHNILLMGLRGQAKTRLLRQITKLLDPLIPIVAGSELNDDPLAPISLFARERVAELGDNTPIEWIPREARYREKLATPDVSIADLIGDLDPVKAANERLSFSHEGVINFGIIPRTNRGIFAVNELPDLQPRIQVGLFNILEEKDVQIRGFPVRLPLDILLCFTANPEDYTNRGSIITPLKDRIESQIITHYPDDLEDAIEITDQEAWADREDVEIVMPDFVRRIIDQIAFEARNSEFVDQASGVSARLPIAAYENIISNVERRAAINGSSREVVRILDVASAIPAITGKIELVYEGEQEGAARVAESLIGKAIRREFEALFPSAYEEPSKRKRRRGDEIIDEDEGEEVQQESKSPYASVIDFFSLGRKLELSDKLAWPEYVEVLRSVEGLEELVLRFTDREQAAIEKFESPEIAVAMELVLEGLHQSSMLAKEDLDRGVLYCDMLGAMFSE